MIDPSTLRWSVKFNFIGPCPLPILGAAYSVECWRLWSLYKFTFSGYVDEDSILRNWLGLHNELEEAVDESIRFPGHEGISDPDAP